MKIAKYVVIGQVLLSAILVVVFATKPGASTTAAAKGHGKAVNPEQAAAVAAVTGDREEAPDLGAWGGEGEDAGGKGKGAGKGADKGGHGEAGGHGGAGKSKTPPRLAARRPGEGEGKGSVAPTPLAGDPKAMAQVLLAGNQRFMGGNRTGFNLVQQREASAGGQHPGVMVLGCADSRVPPELIFDRGVGEMFVVRSAGNIAEPVAVGSLEYAAEHLDAKVLLVLGHEKCGAVQAALSEAKMPSPNLEAVVGAILPAVKELKSWAEGDALIHMAVEANVRRQAEEVLRRSPMLQKMVTRKELTVLKAVYDLESGQVHPL
jgi:carbonic anhydrase